MAMVDVSSQLPSAYGRAYDSSRSALRIPPILNLPTVWTNEYIYSPCEMTAENDRLASNSTCNADLCVMTMNVPWLSRRL